MAGRVGMGEDAARAESASKLSAAVTGSALPATSNRTDSEAAGSTVVSRQPSSHPGMPFAAVDLRAERRAGRIRGGCCVCPSGGFWVCGVDQKDDEHVEQMQLELRLRVAEDVQSPAPLQLSALPPAAGSSRSPKPSKATQPSSSRPEPQNPQSAGGKRPPAQTLPHRVRPDLPGLPRQAAGGRAQSLRTRPPPSLP